MAFISIFLPLLFSARRTAFWITVSVRSPKKSIFRSPNSSMVVMVNCVVMVPSDALDNGTYSSIGFWLITTPAACMDVCLGRPSNLLDISISFFTDSSDSYMPRSSGFINSALSMVIPSSFGIALAIVSTKL